jgi:glycopeptide antibiotics resistance protein
LRPRLPDATRTMPLPTTLLELSGQREVQALVLLAVLLLLVLVAALRRAGWRRTATALTAGALVIAVAATLWLTLRPLALDGPAQRTLYLDPIEGAWGWRSIAWRPVVANVVLFLPVGALAAAVWWRRPLVAVWLGCIALSVTIEAVQYLVPTGRVANAADVLANATGALLGVLVATGLGTRPRPDARVAGDGHSSTTAAGSNSNVRVSPPRSASR